jgi:hypothetical protein
LVKSLSGHVQVAVRRGINGGPVKESGAECIHTGNGGKCDAAVFAGGPVERP